MRHFISLSTSIFLAVALSACASTNIRQSAAKVNLQQLLSGEQMDTSSRQNLSQTTLLQAQKDLEKGQVRSALKNANLALRFDPTSIKAKELAGKAKIANGNYQAGVDDFSQLTISHPTPENFQFLGISHYYLGSHDAAATAFRQALEGDDRLWRAAVMLARIESKQGNYLAADALFALATAHSGQTAAVYDHIGHSYVEREAWPEALEAFEKAQIFSSDAVGRHDQYRLAMAQSGKLSLVLKKASLSETARLYRALGEAALKKGDKLKAVEHLKKAQLNFPQFDEKTQDLLQSAINLPG